MPVYRALFNLSFAHSEIPAGGLWVIPAGKIPDNAVKLEEMGRIARIAPPPLAAIPGWKLRAAKAKRKGGIENAEQLLELSVDEIAALFAISKTQAASWQAEIINWLTIPKDEG